MIFGLAPALQSSRADVVPVLKNELIPSSATRRGLRSLFSLRQGLVVAQVALSLISLVAAGLFLRSLRHQQQIDPGFQTSGVLIVNFNLARSGYSAERGQVFFDELVDRARALPGVQHATIASGPPLAGGLARSVFPEGMDTTTRDRVLVQVNAVGVDYFETLGIPVLRGRAFTTADTAAIAAGRRRQRDDGAEVLAEPGRDRQALQVLRRPGLHDDRRRRERQQVQRGRRGADSVHLRGVPAALQRRRHAARAHGRRRRVAGLVGAARGAASSIRRVPVFNARTLEVQIGNSLQPLRMNVVLLGVFGLLALTAGVDRALRRHQLLGVAAHARDRRPHGARRQSAVGAGARARSRHAAGRRSASRSAWRWRWPAPAASARSSSASIPAIR